MSQISETLVSVVLVVLVVCHTSIATSGSGPKASDDFFEDDTMIDHYPQMKLDEATRNDLAHFFNDYPAQLRKLIEDKLLDYMKLNSYNEKSKRDDDLPPGFIGVRGRRSDLLKMYRNFIDNVANAKNSMLVAPNVDGVKRKMSKKNNAYKDGFLGVRG